MTTQHLVKHDAADGSNVPRYSPEGFTVPVWSDNDLARPDGRRFSISGMVLLIDRRKQWQKKGNLSWDRTGVFCTSLKKEVRL